MLSAAMANTKAPAASPVRPAGGMPSVSIRARRPCYGKRSCDGIQTKTQRRRSWRRSSSAPCRRCSLDSGLGCQAAWDGEPQWLESEKPKEDCEIAWSTLDMPLARTQFPAIRSAACSSSGRRSSGLGIERDRIGSAFDVKAISP